MRHRNAFVYILANRWNTVLYVGVTTDLARRLAQHRSAFHHGFTARYHVTRLVYFEEHKSIRTAIAREKQLKGGSRRRKEELIASMNPAWRDLSEEWS
ncbi:MAG: GIY-YIG nuclease family protein [Gemmatimonadales bacterium]